MAKGAPMNPPSPGGYSGKGGPSQAPPMPSPYGQQIGQMMRGAMPPGSQGAMPPGSQDQWRGQVPYNQSPDGTQAANPSFGFGGQPMMPNPQARGFSGPQQGSQMMGGAAQQQALANALRGSGGMPGGGGLPAGGQMPWWQQMMRR